MAEKLRRGGPAGETEDQTRGIAYFIILSIYILSIQFYIHTIYPVIYPGGVETGACPGGRQGTPRLYNQFDEYFFIVRFAVREKRIREVPLGTVGGRTGRQ